MAESSDNQRKSDSLRKSGRVQENQQAQYIKIVNTYFIYSRDGFVPEY